MADLKGFTIYKTSLAKETSLSLGTPALLMDLIHTMME
jgi:hypothetical protein